MDKQKYNSFRNFLEKAKPENILKLYDHLKTSMSIHGEMVKDDKENMEMMIQWMDKRGITHD